MVTALVSAYFSEKFLDARIVNILDNPVITEMIIVCRAGSPDHEIAQTHEGVVIVTTDDIPTVYAAWNMAIKRSTGKYLISANTDDRFHPNISLLLSALEKGYDLVYGDQEIYEDYSAPPIGRFTWREGELKELMQGCFLGPMPMWRKSLHEQVGYFDESYHVAGDYEFWLRLAKNGKKFYHVREVVGDYLKRPKSVEHREPMRTLWETARARATVR